MQVGPISATATPSMVNGQIQWSYSVCTEGGACNTGSTGHYPAISLPKQPPNSPATPVTVTINDTNHLGITFAAGNDAMWLQPGAGNCPHSSVWDPGSPPQITGFSRTSDTQIRFTDVNNAAGSFTYTLNFVNANHQAVTAIDPDIQNGGSSLMGGINTTQLVIESAVVAFVVALVVSLISSYFIGRRTAASIRERNGK